MDMVQCKLSMPAVPEYASGIATRYQVAWIPLASAKVGVTVNLKADDWTGGDWRIEEVWHGQIQTEEQVNVRSRDYTKTRKASDI